MNSLGEPVTVSEKQGFCEEMMKRLDLQRRNEHFCDVILEVGSGDDQARLKCHRIVLCAASPFFYNALNNDMKEKKEGVIKLKQTSKSMKEVLEYVYTGQVDVNENNAYELLAAGDYFLIPSLKDFSATFILKKLSALNCVAAYYSAIKYRCEKLREGAKDFIHAHFETVTKYDGFLNLSVEQVEEWISSDEIIVDGEERVFEIILRWFEAHKGRNQRHFYNLLHHVRCVYVPHDYLFKVMLPHPFVNKNSKCSTLVLEAMKMAFNGTGECFFSQSPRNCLKTHEDAIFAALALENNNRHGQVHLLGYFPLLDEWRQLDLPDEMKLKNFDVLTSAYHGKWYLLGEDNRNRRGRVSFGARPSPIKLAQRYNPTLNRWDPVQGPLKVLRGFAVVTFQGFLFVIGGESENGFKLNTVQRYNSETNIWQEISPLSSPRSNLCALADEQYMYAIGGDGYLKTVERFDQRTNTWKKCPSIRTGRQNAGGAAMKQKLFVFGGLQPNSTVGDPCEMYNSFSNTWTGISSVVAPRGRASAVSFKGKIYVLGCFHNEQGREENKQCLKIYDIDKNDWEDCKDIHISGDLRCTLSCIRVLSKVANSYRTNETNVFL